MANKHAIFLSHSNADIRLAESIASAFSEVEVPIFLAAKDLQGGDDFANAIRSALRDSDEMCVLVTPSSLKSEWVISEWGAAWALEKRITPLIWRCAPEDLPFRLRGLQAVDYDRLGDFVRQVRQRWLAGRAPRRSRVMVREDRTPMPGTDEWVCRVFPEDPFIGESVALSIRPSGSTPPVSITCEVYRLRKTIQSRQYSVSRIGYQDSFVPASIGPHRVKWMNAKTGELIAERRFSVREH